MTESLLDNASLTVAIALFAGVGAQVIAERIRLPALGLLLLFGVLLGPDGANVVRPSLLGESLHTLIGFAVAVVLFEGGLALDVGRLRQEHGAIQRLVTLGALVSGVGGALAASAIMRWPWEHCLLFGTLIIVTGPTVINPLMRRLRVQARVATVLEAEGVFVDAIGAIVAAVALEIALQPSFDQVASGLLDIASRLGLGAGLGLVGGFAIALALRARRLIPYGYGNIVTLGSVLVLYQLAEALRREAGLAAVIVAGIVVGNAHTRVDRQLKRFKEELTVMLVGVLFVLLAADVRVQEVAALGAQGALLVFVVMFVLRPLTVVVGTAGTSTTIRARLFYAGIAPRGIIAAAVASLFADRLEAEGLAGGNELRAMVFLIIAVTVAWASVTGGWWARRLGVQRPSDAGWLIFGAGPLARELAATLVDAGVEVVCIDRDPESVKAAEARGIRVLLGNGLEPRSLRIAAVDTRHGVIGATESDAENLLFVQRVQEEMPTMEALVALRTTEESISPQMAAEAGAAVLFGAPARVARWDSLLEAGRARRSTWTARRPTEALGRGHTEAYVAIVAHRRGTAEPVSDRVRLAPGDRLEVIVDDARRVEALEALEAAGLSREGAEKELRATREAAGRAPEASQR